MNTGRVEKIIFKQTTFFDNSLLEIGTLGAGKQIFGNEFYQSQITMGTMQGSFFGCYVKASVITFDSCTGYLFNGLTLHDAQFGNNTYVVPQSFVGGEFIFGNNSIGVKLDCSNPAIYDAGLQQLTIPSELAFFVGVITLTNAGGITIKNVLGVSGLSSTTFFNDAGVTTFVSVAVGVALAGEIVSNQPAPHNFNINYRLNGTDYIRLKLLGSVNVVTPASLKNVVEDSPETPRTFFIVIPPALVNVITPTKKASSLGIVNCCKPAS